MITRFRVEATHSDKDALQDQLLNAAAKIQEVACGHEKVNGSWEITDDRIEGKPGNYRGRMVFVFAEGEYVRSSDGCRTCHRPWTECVC